MNTRRSLVAVIITAAICMVGCSISAIDILNLAVGALEVALPLVGPATGVDPATIASVESYLSATSNAISQASDILSGAGTDAQKALAITQAFAGIAKPIIPPQYQALASAVAQVAQYVAQFLAKTTAAKTSPATHQATQPDQLRLSAIHVRAWSVHQKTTHK